MIEMTARAENNQVYVCVMRHGRLSPEFTLETAAASQLAADIQLAVKQAHHQDLESKKSRLIALQAEVTRLEAKSR